MLAKAMRIDGKGEVEGYYYVSFWIKHIIHPRADSNKFEIKPETLKYKVGESYYTQAEIELAMKPKNCESCSKYDDRHGFITCSDTVGINELNTKTFSCDKYEPKDNQ